MSAVKYIHYLEYKSLLANEDPGYVPYDVNGQYGQLFDIITQRYVVDWFNILEEMIYFFSL